MKNSENRIYLNDNLAVLKGLPSESVNLIYADPPFNTGQDKKSPRGKASFFDRRGDRYLDFLRPRLEQAHRVLAADGSMYLHLDYREVFHVKPVMDEIFGKHGFLNEIIWSYDYGARQKKKWPTKHDNILFYVKNPAKYTFNHEAMDRIPYLAPSLVGPEKAARGKTPTDVWWQTIVPTNGRERTGYPTQKPLAILERIIKVSSHPGDTVLDFFAGSGTTGEAAHKLKRKFILVDDSKDAVLVMIKRLAGASVHVIGPLEPLSTNDQESARASARSKEKKPMAKKTKTNPNDAELSRLCRVCGCANDQEAFDYCRGCANEVCPDCGRMTGGGRCERCSIGQSFGMAAPKEMGKKKRRHP